MSKSVQITAQNFLAGLVTSLLQLAYAFSFGGLIFDGSLRPYLAHGVAISLVSAVCLGIIISWKSGFKSAIAGPDTNTATFQAAMMISLEPLLSDLPQEQVLGVALSTLLVSGLVTGFILLLLGSKGMGKFIRYIPFPVVAGFLASTGWLMAKGSLKMVTGRNITLENFHGILGSEHQLALMLTVIWSILLWIMTERIKNPILLPILMVAAILSTHSVLALHIFDGLGINQEYLMMPSPANGESLSNFLSLDYLRPNLSGIKLVCGDILSLVAISIITVLMNTSSIEIATDSDVDLNHELRVHGIANVTSALMGGYAGNSSVSRSLVNYSTGGRNRLSGYVVSAVVITVLITKIDIIGLIPKFVLAGLLLQLGTKLIWDWGWQSKGKISRSDWIIVLILLALTSFVGFIPALVFGLVACCITFVINASAQNIVISNYDLTCRKSSLVRSDEENAVFDKHGGQVKVLVLRGFLFFGSAYSLFIQAKGFVNAQEVKLLILDMTQVSGFDSSATAAVSKLRRFIADRNIEGIIISTQHRITSACRNQGWSFKDDIDDALIYGEDMLIDTAMIKEGRQTMSYWLSEICCGNKDISNYLFKVLELVENNENQLICKAGEESNTLFFIEKGPVAVYTNGDSGEKLRVRVFQDLTLAGEMGFILNTPRSADLEAQDGSIVWSLDRENYYQLISSNPEAERHLLSYIIKLLSERLVFSNREISILRAGAPDHP